MQSCDLNENKQIRIHVTFFATYMGHGDFIGVLELVSKTVKAGAYCFLPCSGPQP